MTIPTKPYRRQAAPFGLAASGTPPRLKKDTKLLMQISRSTRKLGFRIFKIILAIVGGLTGALIVTALGLFFTTSGQYTVVATVVCMQKHTAIHRTQCSLYFTVVRVEITDHNLARNRWRIPILSCFTTKEARDCPKEFRRKS